MGPPTSQLPKVSRIIVAWHTLAKLLADVLAGKASFAGRAVTIGADRAVAALRCHDWTTLGSWRHAVAFQTWAQKVVSALSDRVLLARYRYGAAEVAKAAAAYDSRRAQASMGRTRVVADCIV